LSDRFRDPDTVVGEPDFALPGIQPLVYFAAQMRSVIPAALLLASLPFQTKAKEQDLAVEVTVVLESGGGNGVSMLRLLTRSGQQGLVESGREFAHRGGGKMMTGLALQSCSTIRGSRLAASGILTLRKPVWKKHRARGDFAGFETREVLFDLQVEDGETVGIPLSDGSRADATFRIVPCDP